MVKRAPSAAATLKGAADFTRWAWRRAGVVQLIMAAGIAMLFVSLRAPLQPAEAGRLFEAGFLVCALAWAPLWTTLHRLALGGAAGERVAFGGLKVDRTELRFVVLGVVAGAAFLLLLLPLVAVSAAIFILFRPLGMLGGFQISFFIAAAAWLAGLVGLAYAAMRLSFAPAMTISRKQLVVIDAWPLSANYTRVIPAAWFFAQAPGLLAIALLVVVDMVEAGGLSRWAMPDAIVAGAALGFAVAFVQAPLSAGVLGLLYRHQRATRARLAAGQTPSHPRPVNEPVPFPTATARASPSWEPLVIQRAISKPLPRLDQGA